MRIFSAKHRRSAIPVEQEKDVGLSSDAEGACRGVFFMIPPRVGVSISLLGESSMRVRESSSTSMQLQMSMGPRIIEYFVAFCRGIFTEIDAAIEPQGCRN